MSISDAVARLNIIRLNLEHVLRVDLDTRPKKIAELESIEQQIGGMLLEIDHITGKLRSYMKREAS